MALRRRRARTGSNEEEDWLVTYADAITLLMAFFVMLVSFSKIDLPLFEETMAGIKKELGRQEAPKRPLFELLDHLNSILQSAGVAQDAVETGFDEQGVVLDFASESIFTPQSAEILPQAAQILLDIAYQVRQPPYDLYFVDVEGHTDDVRIASTRFPSNWELSAIRATTVVRFLIEAGIEPERLKAAGYADMKPKVPNRDLFGEPIPENRAKNRRITVRLHP